MAYLDRDEILEPRPEDWVRNIYRAMEAARTTEPSASSTRE